MDFTHMADNFENFTFEDFDSAATAVAEQKAAMEYFTIVLAHLAEKARAGDLVGSPHAADYLAAKLGITRAAAGKYLSQAQALFGRVNKRQRESQRRLRAMVRQRELAPATLDAINAACVKIARQDPKAEVPRLRLEMAENTRGRSVADAKRFIAQMVPKKRSARSKCGAWWSDADADGLYTLKLRVTAADKNLVDACFVREERDIRAELRDKRNVTLTPAQVKYQAAKKVLTRGGGGEPALVVSVTARELAEGHPVFFTNQATTLSPQDMKEIVDDVDMWLAVHHPVDFHVMALGRAKRLASVAQRIALHAEQGVCAAPDCNAASAQCQVHHLQSWKQGGTTDLDNLALLCPYHHAQNADAGPTGTRGQYRRDEDGVVRLHFQGQARENTSTMSSYAAARKLKRA